MAMDADFMLSARGPTAVGRPNFLRSAAVAAASSVATVSALAQTNIPDPPGTMPPPRDWNDPSTAIYPDPAFEIFDRASPNTAAGRLAWCAYGRAASGPRDRYGSATSSC
jgi:hypothetical protein